MKKSSNFKSNKRTKNTLTLKDLKKISQHREYKMSLEEAYEIAAGWKEITTKDPKARSIIYARAMNMVKADDPALAEEIINEKKENKKLGAYLSLNAAYDIVGGYRDADKETYEKAIEIIKNDSPEFAETLLKLRESGTSLKSASMDDLKDFNERLEKNISSALEIYNKDFLEEVTNTVLEDEVVAKAFENTPFVSDTGAELEEEEREETERLVVYTSAIETIPDVIESTDDKDLSKETIVENVKNRTLFNLGSLRIGASRAKTKEYTEAIKDNNESFFANTLSKLRNAFNFRKKVNVKKSAIAEKASKARNKISSYFSKLKERVSSSKLKAKLNKLGTYIVTLAVLTTSCGPINHKQNENNENIKQDTTYTTITTTQNATFLNFQPITDNTEKETKKVTDNTEKETKKVEEEISIPAEWNEDMGISLKRWKKITNKYFKDNKGNDIYPNLYKAIDNEMLKKGDIFEGKTREQVLSFYGYLKAYNLSAHKEAIAILDNLLKKCDGSISISKEEQNKIISNTMKQFTPTGEVIGFNLEGDHYVLSMNLGDCGEKTQYSIGRPAKKATTIIEEKTTSSTQAEEFTIEEKDVIHPADTVTIMKVDSVNVDLYKGNNTNQDEGKFVKTSSVGEVLSEKQNKDKDVVIESSTLTLATDSLSTPAESTLVADSTNIAITSDSTKNVISSEITIDLASIDNTATSNSDSLIINNDTINSDTLINASEAKLPQNIEIVDGVEYEVSYVADSDSLAIGTPAADNIPERGGYNNSGLTEAQYKRAEKYFQRDGDEMFHILVEGVKFHKELRTKGGIAEGLSAEETVYLLMVADLWGGKGQFKEEVAEFINYVNDCDKELNLSESIKNIFNRGNINASMDGIVGKNSNQVDHLELGDCGENPTQIFNKNDKPTTPSNPVSEKFPEFYKIKNTREFAIVFEEEVHEAKTIITTVEEQQDVDITLMKGNDFDVSAGKVVQEGISVEEVQNLPKNKNRTVIVSTSKTYSNEEVTTRREKRKADREAKANSQAPKVTPDMQL